MSKPESNTEFLETAFTLDEVVRGDASTSQDLQQGAPNCAFLNAKPIPKSGVANHHEHGK